MRGAAEALGIAPGERLAQAVEHPRRLGEEGRDELAHEVGAGRRLELAQRSEVDRGGAHRGAPARAGTRDSASTSRSTRIGFVR